MAIDAKEVIANIRKGLMCTIRTSFNITCDHPFLLGMGFFLFILYKCFPSLFAFLVSSSPVIICTITLLGILLIYGEPNLPETEEDKKTREISSLNVGSAANDLVVKKDEGFTVEEKVPEERKVDSQGFVEEREFYVENQAEGRLKMVEDVSGVSTEVQKEIKDPDSSLGSAWQPAGSHNVSSDSDADQPESSSPDASMADTIPMLGKLHSRLDTEPPQPALKSADSSDAASVVSSQDHDSDDDSAMEGEHHDDDEDEEQEEKEDSNKELVKWTAADQRNLIDLGTSEMERNRRLENLMAKRRARNIIRYNTEKNLIDLDSNPPTMEELSCFHLQIPPISATRRNPFDLPYDSEESGLPPIPGSAPSVLLPSRNPFDLPYAQADQSGGFTMESLSHQEFVPAPQRDIIFRRHESFTLGASFSGDLKQAKHDGRINPYFVAQRPEAGSVPVSDMAPSIANHEHHKDIEDVDSVDVDHEPTGSSVCDDCKIDLNASVVIDETHQTVDAFRAVDEEIREMEYEFISDADKVEVIEDNYDESCSSSSDSKKSLKMSTREEFANQGPTMVDSSSKVSSDSLCSIPAESKLLNPAGERINDSQVAYPVYDSSPPAAEKPLDEDLFYGGKRGLDSSSEVSSPSSKQLENNISSKRDFESVNETTDENLGFTSGGLWVASSNLCSVDENESTSREIAEISECDVIQVGLSGVREDLVKPIAPLTPRPLARGIMHPLSFSSVKTKSTEDSLEKTQINILNLPPILSASLRSSPQLL